MYIKQHRGTFYPKGEEYKKITLERTDDLSFRSRSFKSYFHIVDQDKLLSPPGIVEKTIESEKYEIVDVEEADPNSYSSEKSLRIRGYIPLVAIYANKITPDDPRKFALSNSLMFNFNPERYKNVKQEDNFTYFGNLIDLSTFKQFIQHDLCQREFDIDIKSPDNINLYKESKKLQRKYGYNIKFSGSLFVPSRIKPQGDAAVNSVYLISDDLSEKDRKVLRKRFNKLNLPEYQDTGQLGNNYKNKDGIWFWWD